MSRHTFTVATYNVHSFVDSFGRPCRDRTLEVIRTLSADIIALQEVRAADEQDLHDINQAADQLGYEAVFGTTVYHHKQHHYGNMLLVREPVLHLKRHQLSVPGREPRGAIEIECRVAHENWRIIATHLGLSRAERDQQFDQLVKRVQQPAEGHTLVMGDLNEWWPFSRGLTALQQCTSRLPQPRSFPACLPLLPLDRILVSAPQRVRRIRALYTWRSCCASDHLPLLAEIALAG